MVLSNGDCLNLAILNVEFRRPAAGRFSMGENRRMTRAAGVIGAATFLSRIFGFVRDMVIAWFFGAGMAADAFFVAFRLPNLLRRLFAEGALSIAFVPVFTEVLEKEGREAAASMARSAMRLLSLILIGVSAAGVLAAPVLVWIIAPGFADDPEKFGVTVRLTRIMFPYILLVGLVALAMGILNPLGHFAAPALAPVFLNLAMIGAVFFISPYMEDPVTGLAVGVIIGGGLQLLLQLPFLVKKGVVFWRHARLFHPALKKVALLMGPMVFGAAVYQINQLVGTLLASLLDEGSVSYLYYADRLVQFPLGIFAIALATAVLPSLSRQAAANDVAALKETFGYALRLVFFITLPAMVGLIVLREPIVALLFGRGAFDANTVRLTAYALLFYAAGLWAFSAVRIVVSIFYALQDTKTPVKIACVSVAANIVLGIVLMQFLAHGGLALATSLASMVNLAMLLWSLRRRLGLLGMRRVVCSVAVSAACSVLMGAGVWLISFYFVPPAGGRMLDLLVGLAAAIFAGIGIYALLHLAFRSPELGALADMLPGRKGSAGRR